MLLKSQMNPVLAQDSRAGVIQLGYSATTGWEITDYRRNGSGRLAIA